MRPRALILPTDMKKTRKRVSSMAKTFAFAATIAAFLLVLALPSKPGIPHRLCRH